jgi:hypothetical protein
MRSANIVELLVQHTDTGEALRLRGREAWMLACLIEVGESGLTVLDRPAPRLSAYVHSLRKRGLVIDTIDERHAGPYPGAHGRYVIRTPLVVVQAVTAEEKRQRRPSTAARAAQTISSGHAPNSAPRL